MMRIIRVRPGTVVYVGDIEVLRGTSRGIVGPSVGTFEYRSDFETARTDFRQVYTNGSEMSFVGFVE